MARTIDFPKSRLAACPAPLRAQRTGDPRRAAGMRVKPLRVTGG